MEIRLLVRRKQQAYLRHGQLDSAKAIQSAADNIESLGIVEARDLLTAIDSRRVHAKDLVSMIWLAARILPPSAIAPALVQLLRTTRDRQLWFQAAMGLGKSNLKMARTALIQTLLTNPVPWKRCIAAHALQWRCRHNTDVCSALLAAAKNDLTPTVRSHAIEALALGPKRIIPELRLLLRDRSSSVRFWTCYAVSQVGGAKEIEDLMALVVDKTRWKDRLMNRTVSEEARWAIRQLRKKLKSPNRAYEANDAWRNS